MNKRRGVPEVSSGILSGLEEMNNVHEEKKQINKTEPEEDPNKKFKRSYMLTKKQIKKVNLLKAHLELQDLSEIVRDAIDLYYKEITGEDDV